jgi:heme/copper-type cytochrome/quinol oxidase subunit 2
VAIAIRGGRPVGGIRRVTVAKNRQVVLVVRSDVADHMHLHGYDVMRDVAPGAPAQLRFRATIPGRFEVELEDRGLQIADITVTP